MSQTTPSTAGPLTVVLVQGAFADASSWTGVIERLQAGGVQVTAPANPLRGLSSDSAYLAIVFAQIRPSGQHNAPVHWLGCDTRRKPLCQKGEKRRE